MADNLDFAGIVERFYEPLYRFAHSLTRSEADAADLTQHSFQVFAEKGGGLRDPAKVKSWLFTVLHRKFLERCRRDTRFPHQDLDSAHAGTLAVSPPEVTGIDADQVLAALATLDETFRAPLALFYLEDHSYPEIAEVLDVPLGTVKSRIARGVRQLKTRLGVDRQEKEARRD